MPVPRHAAAGPRRRLGCGEGVRRIIASWAASLLGIAPVQAILHVLGLPGVELLTTSPGLLAAATLAATALLAVVLAVPTSSLGLRAAAAAQIRSSAMRRRAWRTAFLPQRDPDADGRPRPRAPAGCPVAA